MSNLGPQQQNNSFVGLLQVPGGITAQLQNVQDGDGNITGLQVSSLGINAVQSLQIAPTITGTPGSDADVVNTGTPYDPVFQFTIPAGPAGQSVATVAALRLVADPASQGVVQTLGCVAEGDGGGGVWYWSPSSTATDNTGTIVLPTGWVGAGRWIRSVTTFINLKWFGAVGDGVTNDRNAIQSALTYATANNVRLYIPAGTYYVPNTSANNPALSFSGNLSIVGDGMDRSILYYDDNTASTRRDFFTSTSAGNIDFSDVAFQSTWGQGGDYSQRSQLTSISTGDTSAAGINKVIITRCKFSYSRYMSLILNGFYESIVSNCVFQNGVADGCRITNSASVTVTSNYFNNINDDSIAVHTNTQSPSPSKTTVVVSNNKIVDGQGIACLGAKDITITGNSLTRVQSRGIFVGGENLAATEGKTSTVALTITGNTITDVFKGSIFFVGSGDNGGYIQVAGFNLNDIGSGYVGGANGSGGVLQPWSYLYTNNQSALTQNPGNYFIVISGNVCARTLAPTANYSDYGFGVRLARGGPVNPVIGQSSFDAGGHIQIKGAVQGLHITGNVVSGAHTWGLYFSTSASLPAASYKDVLIDGNTFVNIVSTAASSTCRAIQWGEGYGTARIVNNMFDLDPYCISVYRTANGKWDTTKVDFAAAITCGEVTPSIENCVFKNMGSLHGGGFPANWYWKNNTIICDPVSYGLDANNIGIGDPGAAQGYDATYIIEDGDPSSSTYGVVINTCLQRSGTIPTTGKYVTGAFVKKYVPTVSGTAGSQYLLQGWYRATTGTSHALGTDWIEVRTLTGT